MVLFDVQLSGPESSSLHTMGPRPTAAAAGDQSKASLVDTKWNKFRHFMGLMKVDIVVFLFTIGTNMQGVTITQLAEDKMCINQLHQPWEYCLTLTSNHSDDVTAGIVLRHANTIKNWQILIMNIPSTIVSAFLGYWLDMYPHYLKMMVILPCIGVILQILILLINSLFFGINSWDILIAYIPSALCGGTLLIFGVYFTYIAWSTPPSLMIIRFAVLEFLTQLACVIGTFTSGYIMAMTPWLDNQPENYIGILCLALVSLVAALLFALSFKFDGIPQAAPEYLNHSHGQVLREVFKFSRLAQLFRTAFKPRPNNGRFRVIMLLLSVTLCLASIHGEDAIAYQYAQRVYAWSAEEYTRLFALLNIIPALLTSIGPQIFKSFLKLPDSVTGIIGTSSILTMSLIRGTILSPTGFALVYVFGALNKVSVVALRTLLSLIVEPNETSKLFTLSTALDCYSTLGAAYLYTSVFSATIENNPGLVYQIVSIILLFPVATCLWLELTRSKWQVKSLPLSLDSKKELPMYTQEASQYFTKVTPDGSASKF